MGRLSGTAALIAEHLSNPDTQWSLGTFGGIAEFSRDPEEAVELDFSDNDLSAVTVRGGIRLLPSQAVTPFASESIGSLGWNHRVALCLPESRCAMHRRSVFTEIGPDAAALRESDREAVLFDLGLDALQADLCVRVADHAVAAELRGCTGRPVFDSGNPAMRIILAANPHRVFISRVGRAEVYQPIPAAGGRSPAGPHTHVLPKLLRHRRTHAATEPVPKGFVPCAHFYPRHPLKDARGGQKPFEDACHRAFQKLLEQFGAADHVALKARVAALVAAGQGPQSMSVASDRLSRTTVRLALRQLRAADPSPGALTEWLAAYDRGDDGSPEDDPQTLGH